MKKLEMLTALSLVISSANTAPQNRLIIKQ